VSPPSARRRQVGVGAPDPSTTVETIARDFGRLLIENKQLPKTMSSTLEKEPKETKTETAREEPLALENALNPFQLGSGGFMDDVEERPGQIWSGLVPQYRKKPTMHILQETPNVSREPGHIDASFLAEVKNVDLRPELNQCEVISSWATRLAKVRKTKTDSKKKTSKEKSELTGNLLRSEIIPKNFGFISLTLTPLRYDTTTDTLYRGDDSQAQVVAHECIILPDKPIDVPPPKTLGEARKSAWWEGYRRAITEEITNLEALGCWQVIPRDEVPRGANIMRSKFVFDDKRASDGKLLKYKARLVAMGFTQIEGVDYDETFASVMTTKSFRTLLAIWNLNPAHTMEHWDIKQAFVNAPLSQALYVHPVTGFGMDGKVLKLAKALYGTKQAAHEWQNFLRLILVAIGGGAMHQGRVRLHFPRRISGRVDVLVNARG